jgi:hypothetical protein
VNAEVLHRDLCVTLELGICWQALWLNVEFFDAINLDPVQLAALLPLLRLAPFSFGGLVRRRTLLPVGLDVRVPLFALDWLGSKPSNNMRIPQDQSVCRSRDEHRDRTIRSFVCHQRNVRNQQEPGLPRNIEKIHRAFYVPRTSINNPLISSTRWLHRWASVIT